MEYNDCLDCDDYFFEDLKCEFEQDEGEVVEDDIVDYNVFVLNEQNLQRELANILLADASETPASWTRRINNLADMYMQLLDTSSNEPQDEYMKQHFRPVVTVRKFIHDEDGKPKVEIRYPDDYVDKETIGAFIDRHNTLKSDKAFRPFANKFSPETENNRIIRSNVDGFHNFYDPSTQETYLENVRLLKGDNMYMVGLACVRPYTDISSMQIFKLSSYKKLLDSLRVGLKINVVFHTNVPGLDDGEAVVERINNDIVTFFLKDKNKRIQLNRSSVKEALSSPFCVHQNDVVFAKKYFWQGSCIVLFDNIEEAKSVIPTLSEWMHCRRGMAAGIYNFNDVKRVFGEGEHMINVETHVKDVIRANIADERRRLKTRTPAKLIRKIYKQKTWPRILQIKGFGDERTSIDTRYNRMMFLQKTKSMQSQILACTEEDLKELKDKISLDRKLEPTRQSDSIKSKVEKISKQLQSKKSIKVFNHINEADSAPPTSPDDVAVVWSPKTREFIYLIGYQHGDVMSWFIDIQKAKNMLKDIDDSIEYDSLSRTVCLEDRAAVLLSKDIDTSVESILANKPNEAALLSDKRNSLKFLDTEYAKPVQITLNVDANDEIEGDEDYFDFDQMLNNVEHGVSMEVLPDGESDDDGLEELEENITEVINEDIVHKDTLYDIIRRLAVMLGVSLDADQLTFVYQHSKLNTSYLTTLNSLKTAEIELLGQLKAKAEASATDLAKFEKAKVAFKAQFMITHAKKMEPELEQLCYHLLGLMLIIVQARLPVIQITPFPEHTKRFGLEGFPFSVTDDNIGNTLSSYISHVAISNVGGMKEFEFLRRMKADECEAKIKSKIETILESTPKLQDDITAAQERHVQFKKQHEAVMKQLGSYGIWDTFRPYFDVKNIQVNNESITEVSASYISLVQKAVEKVQPLKLGVNKTPLQRNSCCMEEHSANIGFWNFFLERPEVKKFVDKFHVLLSGNERSNQKYGVLNLVYRQHEPAILNSMKIAVKNAEHLGSAQVVASKLITQQSLMSKALLNWFNSNPLYKDDTIINTTVQLPHDESSWSSLATHVFDILGEIVSLNEDHNVADQVEGVKAALMSYNITSHTLPLTLVRFLATDLKTLFGKLLHSYKLGKIVKNNGQFGTEVIKALHKAHIASVPGDLLTVFARYAVEDIQANLKTILQNGLNSLQAFEAVIKMKNSGIEVVFLMAFILATVLKQLSPSLDDDGELKSIKQNLVSSVISAFSSKYNNNVALLNASDIFEKQREESKQNVIAMMKKMKKGDRDLIKDLKERGLVNLQEMVESGGDISSAYIVRREQDQNPAPAEEERDSEIINDIANNQGENDDGIEYDDDRY